MKILVTGGAGYVGAVLVPQLIRLGHQVTVYDLFLYMFGENTFRKMGYQNDQLDLIPGDIRDQIAFKKAVKGHDVVIHLACISNDPSFDLNPELGKSVNLDSFRPLVEISKAAGVKRFIYASSSSVYGVKEEDRVTEEMSLEPLTDYSKFKAKCEGILLEYTDSSWTTVTVRPATVCGYSPRQRLDLVVNIMATAAYFNKEIQVFGGSQTRPNIHIADMCDAYCMLINIEHQRINGKVFNVGGPNHCLNDLAFIVKRVMGDHVGIVNVPTNDMRSYKVCSDKIKYELGFTPKKTIEEAVSDLKRAFESGMIPDALTDIKYYNIRTMKKAGLK